MSSALTAAREGPNSNCESYHRDVAFRMRYLSTWWRVREKVREIAHLSACRAPNPHSDHSLHASSSPTQCKSCRGLWEVLAESPADAWRICGEEAETGAEGSSTCCYLEEGEIGPAYMQGRALLWLWFVWWWVKALEIGCHLLRK